MFYKIDYLACMQITQQLTNNLSVKKHIYIAILGAILGILVCYFLIFSEQQDVADYQIKDGFFAALSGVLITFVIYRTTKFLNKLISWQTQTGNRLFAGLLVHFIIAFVFAVGCFYLYDKVFTQTPEFGKTYEAVFIKIAIILFIAVLIFEVIYFALYSYYSYATLQIETVKQERKQIELQLKALKSQLSPHFLFNSLNTISSLVFKDGKKAENFIRRLANMYDYTLKSYNQKLITLGEELEFVESYKYLVQTRFENKFTCNISISDDLLETKIPPLTLQMLVENAVKHNQLNEQNPLQVSITSDKNSITIHNNLTEKPKKVTSFNIGLKNINARYLLLSHQAISVTNGQNFTVKIPVIR